MGITRRQLLTTGILGVMAALTAAAWAGPPAGKGGGKGGGDEGGSAPAGSVYFNSGGQSFVMDAAGNNVQATVGGMPSRTLHNGYRWFLQLWPIAGTYPNGEAREELVAVREDAGAVVTLISDPNFQPLVTDFNDDESFQWATDFGVSDGKVSFGARRWDTNGELVEQGIFEAIVSYDSNGEPSGAGATSLVLWVDNIFAWVPEPDTDPLDVLDHSWAPGGTELTYSTRDTSDLYIFDTVSDTTHFVAGGAGDAAYSPDGTILAFSSNDGLETTDLATGERKLHVARVVRNNGHTSPIDPAWLPEQTAIVYTLYDYNRKARSYSENVHRVTLATGKTTALTTDGVSRNVGAR